MKPNLSLERLISKTAQAVALCLAAVLLAPSAVTAGESTEDEAVDEDVDEDAEIPASVVGLSFGGVSISGDDAAYKARHGGPNGDFFGGIDTLHVERELGENMMLTLDGHLLFGTEDYELDAKLEHYEYGFIRGGFRQYRTWYDGSGGYIPPFPGSPQGWWIPSAASGIPYYDDEMRLDRGELWFEGGLRMEDLPEITFWYSHSWRNGNKDSTSWGSLDEFPRPNISRYIVPGINRIDETRDSFRIDVTHTLGKTDLGLGLRYDSVDNENARSMRHDPSGTASRAVTQYDNYDSDLVSAHLFSETRFNDELWLTAAYSFMTLNSNIGGSRVSGPGYYSPYDPTWVYNGSDHAFLNLMGGGETGQSVANLNLFWMPIENLTIRPSLRYEWQDTSAWSGFTTILGTPAGFTSRNNLNEFAQELEIEYTGVPDLVLYARGEWMQGDGDIWEKLFAGGAGTQLTDSSTDIQKYVIGANWYPLKGVSVAAQYYNKSRDEDWNHLVNTLDPGGYPGFLTSQDFNVDDANLRLTWRALDNLTLVSRYDFQRATINTQGLGLARIESAEITRNMFSQNVTWNPLERLYLQGSYHYVTNETDTPTDRKIGLAVHDFSSDYWMVTLSAGYAFDKRTDLRATYFHYESDNYLNNAAVGVPYGMSAREDAFSLTLNHRFSPSMSCNLGYGYFKGDDTTSGGFNDYDAHVVSTGFRYRF